MVIGGRQCWTQLSGHPWGQVSLISWPLHYLGRWDFNPEDPVFTDCHGLHFISGGCAPGLSLGHPHALPTLEASGGGPDLDRRWEHGSPLSYSLGIRTRAGAAQGGCWQFHFDLLSTGGLRDEKDKVPSLSQTSQDNARQRDTRAGSAQAGFCGNTEGGETQFAAEGHSWGKAGVSWPLQASRIRFCYIWNMANPGSLQNLFNVFYVCMILGGSWDGIKVLCWSAALRLFALWAALVLD